MRILVARPASAAARTAARLAGQGHEAIVAPAVAIVPTASPVPDGPFDALILTSANAAGPAASARLGLLPVFAVGAETARAARAAGFADVTAGGGDALDMANRVGRSRPPPGRLLLAAGRDRKPEPADSLGRAGYTVAIWPAYAAEAAATLPEAARAALVAGTLDAAVHYSRRSAAILLRLADEAGLGDAMRRLRHLCISADAAAGLAGCADIAVAASPDEDALLRLTDR